MLDLTHPVKKFKKYQTGKYLETENEGRLRDTEIDRQKGRGWRVDSGRAVEWYCKAADGEQMDGAWGSD